MFEGDIRVIFPDGSDEVMPASVALRSAQNMGLDLILVEPNANPPVAKATNYGLWHFEQKKTRRAARREHSPIPLKQLTFAPDIADHDYRTKLNQVLRLLAKGNEVRLVVPIHSRELLQRLSTDLKSRGLTDANPKLQATEAILTIRPQTKFTPTHFPNSTR